VLLSQAIRKERFSGLITIWSSRASQPMARSKKGAFAFTWFFSCVSDNSPWVLKRLPNCPCSLADFFSVVIRFP
jgi:hypothetical protein